jgi:hypothetical protein
MEAGGGATFGAFRGWRLWARSLVQCDGSGRNEGEKGKVKMRVICPLWRVGAMPNIGTGHKVAFRGFFEGVRGQHGNGDGVRVVRQGLYLYNCGAFVCAVRVLCALCVVLRVVRSQALRVARWGTGAGRQGVPTPMQGRGGARGSYPPFPFAKIFYG